jgi:NADPH2:quinone reductase
LRAALISELGRLPEPAELPDPSGDDVVEVAAAALNPIDVNVGAGRFYGGHPELPYVPGCECVGRVDGRLVYVFGGGFGLTRNGGMAERAVAPVEPIPVSEDADPALACALGIAGLAGWLPVAWRAPVREGDRVLVLGATGTAGTVAAQAARLLGASRVVAAGRNADALARVPADERVQLDGDDLAERFKEACGGDGPTYVVDPLWGEPAAAAVQAAAPGARIVNLGQSAGPEATFTSAAVRGKHLEIYGHSNFAVPRDELAREYGRLVSRAVAGEIELEIERYPLDRVADAWQRQASGSPGAKLVIVP